MHVDEVMLQLSPEKAGILLDRLLRGSLNERLKEKLRDVLCFGIKTQAIDMCRKVQNDGKLALAEIEKKKNEVAILMDKYNASLVAQSLLTAALSDSERGFELCLELLDCGTYFKPSDYLCLL